MKRGKKIAIVSHCILNVNAKVDGLATYSASVNELVTAFQEQNIGLVQLPCPELLYLGPKRWGMTKNQYDTTNYRLFCQELLQPVIQQIEMYLTNGYEIVEIVGVDGSPTCGVAESCQGYCGGCIETAAKQVEFPSQEPGILIEELKKALANRDIYIPFSAINEQIDY